MENKKIALLSYRALHDKCDCRIGFDSFGNVDVFTTDYIYIKHDSKKNDDCWYRKNVRIKNALLKILHLSLKEKLSEYREVYIYLGKGPRIPETFTWEIYKILHTLINNKIKARIVSYLDHEDKASVFFKEELSERFKNYSSLDLRWIKLQSNNIELELISLIDRLIEGSK